MPKFEIKVGCRYRSAFAGSIRYGTKDIIVTSIRYTSTGDLDVVDACYVEDAARRSVWFWPASIYEYFRPVIIPAGQIWKELNEN